MSSIWTYRDEVTVEPSLEGFSVIARDGEIGKIDDATYDVDASYLVVDAGQWIVGAMFLLPAGIVEQVDLDGCTLFISRTREQVRAAPRFDEARLHEVGYSDKFGAYYRAHE